MVPYKPPSASPQTIREAPKQKKPIIQHGGRTTLLESIRAGKKLSKVRYGMKTKSKIAPRPMSLMDNLKDRLQARNNLMAGKQKPIMIEFEAEDGEHGDDGLGLADIPIVASQTIVKKKKRGGMSLADSLVVMVDVFLSDSDVESDSKEADGGFFASHKKTTIADFDLFDDDDDDDDYKSRIVKSDPFASSSDDHEVIDDEEQMALSQAPTSIGKDEQYDLSYRPNLETVPTFKVDATLPGLIGIGDDLDRFEEHRRSLVKIADDVIDLKEAFTDLNMLVAEQSEDIGHIEQNVDAAKEEVLTAEKHLDVGRRKGKRRKKRKKKSKENEKKDQLLEYDESVSEFEQRKCSLFALCSWMMDKFKQWRKSKKLIDSVFADIENMFYLLSRLLVFIMYGQDWDNCITMICKLLVSLIIYPLVMIVSIIIILPSLFFLLLVRVNKIEVESSGVSKRRDVIEQENKCKRFYRLICQCIRSLFMFSLIGLYPVIITFYIIPYHGNGEYHEYVILASIGSYLGMILLLQLFGSYRGIKSYNEKKKTLETEIQFKRQKFTWNIGTIIAVLLLIYEMFQFAMIASHLIDSDSNNKSQQNDKSSVNLSFLEKFNGNKIGAFITKICYLSIDFMDENVLEIYIGIGTFCVGLLLSFFVFRFVYELRKYGVYKYIKEDKDTSKEFYFHCFVGTIIYGHGTLKNVNKISCKIVSLLSDGLFLIIFEKLILILSCIDRDNNGKSYSLIDEDVVCWKGKHQIYALIALILIGYYVPFCSMIAPMFAENLDDIKEIKKNKFFSLSNTVRFIQPFMCIMTLSKCFMLISSRFIFREKVFAIIISQLISMIVLFVFTLKWSLNSLRDYGLTQNEPGFPFSICMIRICGFFCGFIGCIIQLLIYLDIIDSAMNYFILFVIIIISSVAMMFVVRRIRSKFIVFNNKDITNDFVIQYDPKQKNQNVKIIQKKT